RGAELPVAEGAADEADAAVMAAAQPGARRGRRRRGRRGRVKEPELQGRQRSTQPSAGSSLADRPGGARVPHGLREGSEGDIGSGDAGDVDAGDGGHEGEQSQTEVI